jgi:hypothetical protein
MYAKITDEHKRFCLIFETLEIEGAFTVINDWRH